MKNAGKGAKVFIIGIILICLVLGYYYYLSNKRADSVKETKVKITAVQEALMYDFERNYPPTPKEVVKLFGQITQCFYNEEYTEEEFGRLALAIEKLYDAELIANKTHNQYLEDLKWDVEQMKKDNIVISNYATSASTDVDYFSQDGFDWARLYCAFSLRQGTKRDAINEIFLLRKDEEGHWKIYGWTAADDENGEAEELQEE